jgi:hypothetical protein
MYGFIAVAVPVIVLIVEIIGVGGVGDPEDEAMDVLHVALMSLLETKHVTNANYLPLKLLLEVLLELELPPP